MRKYRDKRICLLAGLLIILLGYCVGAEAEAGKTVKVGFLLMPGFSWIYTDGQYDGYGYEYLQKISQYTGWHYRYIHGDYQELSRKLQKGEIDLLAPLPKTEKEKKRYDFSEQEIGTSYIQLLTREEESRFSYENNQALDGARLGMLKNHMGQRALAAFCKKNEIQFQIFLFDNYDGMAHALQKKKIDLLLNQTLRVTQHEKAVAEFLPQPVFFATSKGNTPILQALNRAIAQINRENPNYEKELFRKYYHTGRADFVVFTEAERDYLKKNAVLRLASIGDSYPIEYYNARKETYEGIAVDMLGLILKHSGLEIERIPLQTKEEVIEKLKKGEADIICMAPPNYYAAEKAHLYLSDEYISLPMGMVHKKGLAMKADPVVALPRYELNTGNYVHRQFPFCKIRQYDKLVDCLHAVQQGEADCVIYNYYVVSSVLAQRDYGDLMTLSLLQHYSGLCVGISKQCDPLLVSIINKAIHKISETEKNHCIIKNVVKPLPKVTLMDFIKQYSFNLLIFIIFASIVIICLIYRRKEKVAYQMRILAQTDQLTQLYHRMATEKRIDRCIDKNQEQTHAFFVIDIDQFKQVNDTAGHPFGDMVLCDVAKKLVAIFSDKDIIGRLGGDEFAVFMKNYEHERAVKQKADEIIESLQRIYQVEENSVVITVSVGIALYPKHGDCFAVLYHYADKALYCAKDKGENQWDF